MQVLLPRAFSHMQLICLCLTRLMSRWTWCISLLSAWFDFTHGKMSGELKTHQPGAPRDMPPVHGSQIRVWRVVRATRSDKGDFAFWRDNIMLIKKQIIAIKFPHYNWDIQALIRNLINVWSEDHQVIKNVHQSNSGRFHNRKVLLFAFFGPESTMCLVLFGVVPYQIASPGLENKPMCSKIVR